MKEELAIRAVKAFPDLFRQNLKHRWGNHPTNGTTCKKCGVKWKQQNGLCTVPDPIDINDWNVAMKLRYECNALLWDKAFLKILDEKKSDELPTPADYIEVACVAKEAENGRT